MNIINTAKNKLLQNMFYLNEKQYENKQKKQKKIKLKLKFIHHQLKKLKSSYFLF